VEFAAYVASGVMLRSMQYVTVGGCLTTLSPLCRNIMLCAPIRRRCGNRRILLSCFGVRRQRVRNEPGDAAFCRAQESRPHLSTRLTLCTHMFV